MKLLVLDGNSILNRAFYGIKLLSTKDGQFTNAIYGFMTTFMKILEESQPNAVAIAFDLKAPTFRHKAYDGYKSNRKGMPEELASQLEPLKELFTYPMWSYYGKKMPGHSDLLGQMQTLMKRHRDVTFVIAHVGSLANDLDRVEHMMDVNPNMYVDIAAVLAELGRQPLRFHAFAEKFQERILFGTDMFGGDPICYEQYYRFLGTRDEYFPYHPEGRCTQGDWRIYGTGLSKTVLRKIYYSNAEKVYLSVR